MMNRNELFILRGNARYFDLGEKKYPSLHLGTLLLPSIYPQLTLYLPRHKQLTWSVHNCIPGEATEGANYEPQNI